ncbi:glycosyltransferase [Desulfosediminicola sp.]|uniref:glycosyltransferase n=1 Tax=Desulfosediminicola sp. TaxID=2886825 RepID=UPI003AF27340
MVKKRDEPVFFDPRNKRWQRVKGVVTLLAVFLTLVLTLFLMNLFLYPQFKPLQRPLWLTQTVKRLSPGWSPITVGFHVHWDRNSYKSLKAHIEKLDVVIGDWLHLASGDGSLTEDNSADRKQVLDFIHSHKPDTKVIGLVSNFSEFEWDSESLSQMLAQPQARKRAILQLLQYAQAHQLAGICIDFEAITEKSLPVYYRFLDEFRSALHASDLAILVAVPADNDDYDYRKISELADYVVVMAYDEHWSTGSPGPIASMDWFSSAMRRLQGDVPSEKMILTLGNYSYDWEMSEQAGEDGLPAAKGPAEVRTFKDVVFTATWSKGEIAMDPFSLNPMFQYEDKNNNTHQVWMLDAITLFNQMAMAKPLEPFGIALWRLGSEDPMVWEVLGDTPDFNSRTAGALGSIDYDYSADYQGDGEVMSMVRKATSGKREIDFDKNTGLIITDQYTVFPFPSLISLSGAADRKIALSFDDGPNPSYTPLILDELKKAQVPATFFITGYNGLKYPSLLKRVFAEGHEIGNHTFTHPNIAKISWLRLRAEIKATELLLEKVIGRGTRLFRAPYNTDSEPVTAKELRPLELISSLGYEEVGLKIDTHDWQELSAGEMVKKALEEEAAYGGNILLMHDAGGDRSQSVKALPGIIHAFRQKGYEFVTVSQLTGKTRAEVMPETSKQSTWSEWGRNLGFNIINLGQDVLSVLFVTGIILGLSRTLFIMGIALLGMVRKNGSAHLPEKEFFVSVIIPAYNEEKVIRKTIDSLLIARHPESFEILIIDDGSTDATYKIVQEAYSEDPIIRMFSIPNGGKHQALNFGIEHALGEIIVTFDADTVIAKDALVLLAKRFSDSAIGAVAGNAKVGNRINLLTRWQALEYITCQNMDRRALDVLNGITVVPGAIGAWRREALKQTGGFSADTLAEDSDLTVQIIKQGYKVCYEDKAIASTEAPADIKGFLRQRFRWMFGTFQVAWKHKDALFRPKNGFLGFFSLPNLLLHQIFFPLISPVMDLVLLLSLLSAALNRWQHSAEFSPDTLLRIFCFYSIFLAADLLSATIAFFMEREEDKRLLLWVVPQRFFYRQLLYYVAIKSIVASLRGQLVGWNKLDRAGTVEAA